MVHQPGQRHRRVQLHHLVRAPERRCGRQRARLTPPARTATARSEVTPSFILLAVQGPKVVTFVYEMKNGKLDITQSEFSKSAAGGGGGGGGAGASG